MGDTSEVERIDGFSGVGEVRAPRKRVRHTEPLNLSVLDIAEAYVGLAVLWEMSDGYEKILDASYSGLSACHQTFPSILSSFVLR